MCSLYVRLYTRDLHSQSHLLPMWSLQSRFFPPDKKKIEDQRWNNSLRVTQLLTGSEVSVLSTIHHGPHCQGLHRPPNADSQGFPYMWFLHLSQVSLPSMRAHWSQHNLQDPCKMGQCFSECPNTDDGTRSGQFLRYEARWTQRVLLPIALTLTHLLKHAKACLEWRRKGSPWVILYPPSDCYKIKVQCWGSLAPWKPTSTLS